MPGRLADLDAKRSANVRYDDSGVSAPTSTTGRH
jgi:hypothetical protein